MTVLRVGHVYHVTYTHIMYPEWGGKLEFATYEGKSSEMYHRFRSTDGVEYDIMPKEVLVVEEMVEVEKPPVPVLNLYLATHRGVYLGGYSLVWAPDTDTALDLLHGVLDEQLGINSDEDGSYDIDLTPVDQPTSSTARLIWNGDY